MVSESSLVDREQPVAVMTKSPKLTHLNLKRWVLVLNFLFEPTALETM